MSAADGVAVDHGDDGLGQPAYLHLHVEHREPGHSLVVDVSAPALHVHVAARAEGVLDVLQPLALGHLAHLSRQQHHAYALQLAAVGEGLAQLQRRLGCEGIAVARPVDGDLGDAVELFEAYLFELPNLFPLSLFHSRRV